MLWIMRRTLLFTFLALGITLPLAAQDVSDGVARRSEREISCLGGLHAQLGQVLELLRQARAQMDMQRADPQARRDAANAVEALEQRARDVIRSMKSCIEAPEPAPPPQQTQPAPFAAEVANDPLPTVDEPRRLSDNVRVVSALRVDGVGMVPGTALAQAMTRITPRLDACYQRLVQHGALARGRGILVFSVNERGRVGRIETEGFTIDDHGFQRCVRRAGAHLRPGAGSDGGISRYSYTLDFGPPEP